MANDPNIKPSSLEKLSLSFEYDMTWQDAKKAIRRRADNR